MLVRFTLLALVAAATALPATDYPGTERDHPLVPIFSSTIEDDIASPWFSFPSLSNIFAPLFKLIPSFADFGPKITYDADKFEVFMNAKGYTKDDLKIKTKGSFIFVQGSHHAKQDAHDMFVNEFFHTYSMPENASSADIKANLYSDGILQITVPIDGPVDKTKEVDREISIVDTGVPYKQEDKEVAEDKTTLAPVTSAAPEVTTTPAPEEEKKEPTTPEDATEKDNIIPHGNEVVNP